MNDSSSYSDEHRTIESRPPLGEDLLPPVEEPSARFIIQLFVVPALIVLLIVTVWLSFNWLVRRTELDPKQLIQGIEQGPSVARWQRAKDLADLLHDKRYPEFRQSREGAVQLSRILDREIDEAEMEEGDVEFRKYLARALGEIDVPDGTDVLLKAAQMNRDSREQRVRDAALQAIAVRAYNLPRLKPPVEFSNSELESTLLRLAADADPSIRFQAVYVLGQIGTPPAIERLEVMVNDPDPGTRYNAAVALAHRGNVKAIETLAEMLDISEQAGVRDEKDEGKGFKRTVIVVSAIDAVRALADKNKAADLTPLIAALEQIVSADSQTIAKAYISPKVVSDAKRALDSLQGSR